MKKIIYNIAIVLAASCLFASCEDDNYDEPNSGIKGRFIDAETSEVVPMPVQGTSSIQIRMYERDRYYSTGDDYSQLPVITYPKIDGTYENSWMFSKQYILTLEQTNFYPVDTMVVDLNAGGEIGAPAVLVEPADKSHRRLGQKARQAVEHIHAVVGRVDLLLLAAGRNLLVDLLVDRVDGALRLYLQQSHGLFATVGKLLFDDKARCALFAISTCVSV